MSNSINGNKYVQIKDIKFVYTKGKYDVGIDIKCGKYYFWGDSMEVNIKGKSEHFFMGDLILVQMCIVIWVMKIMPLSKMVL